MANDKKTAEEAFRESLQDVVVVLRKLGPMASNVNDLTDCLEVALASDTQLNILMALVTAKK